MKTGSNGPGNEMSEMLKSHRLEDENRCIMATRLVDRRAILANHINGLIHLGIIHTDEQCRHAPF